MQIGNVIIEPWSRQNAVARIIILSVVLAWALVGVFIFQESKNIEARLQAQRQEEINRQLIERRKASFDQQAQEQRNIRTGSRNIMDTLPGGEL